jgi:hypothetical protein
VNRWFLFGLLAVVLIALLCACETVRTEVEPPQKVDVPVAVSCLPTSPPVRPRLYSDPELYKLDDFKLTLALRHNAESAWGYALELEAVLRGCK